MKFFHLINVHWYNGTAWFALNICKLLQKNGHSVIVGVLPNSENIKKAHEMGLKTIEDNFTAKNPFAAIGAAYRLNKFLKEFNPDFVTAHRGEMFWFLALKRYFGAKFHLSRVRGDQRPPKPNFVNKFLHNNCTDTIITSGEWIKNLFIQNLKTDPQKIAVIYGGVDREIFKFDSIGRESVRAEFGIASGEKAIGLVGRYSEVKGHKSLIDALKILRDQGGKGDRGGKGDQGGAYKLICVTDSADLDIAELRAYIEARGLNGAAFITGFRKDIAACISAFDVGVVSSLGSEAICRAAFEIVSVGVPLIVTTAGSLPEIAQKGNIVPPNDPPALAGAIGAIGAGRHAAAPRIFDEQDFVCEYLAAIGAK